MSDLLKHLDINHNHEAGLIPVATRAKIKQAADLLDECERVIEQMCQVAEGVPMTATKSSKYFAEALVTLARLRAQERS